MKKLAYCLAFSFFLMPFMVSAQNAADPVIFEVGGKPIYKSQFMKEFLRSIGKDPAAAPTACTYEKRKALEDYVQLYVNFQAKLADAYALGYDTLPSLKRELASYRDELAAPYLIDSLTMQTLLREAYERNHYVLHAAHVLVPCTETALPADTAKAYARAMELYNRAIAGENFYTLAQEEMHNQRKDHMDPEIRAKANQVNPTEGDLGCFTVFDMIYAFESAAYALQPSGISKPVRTRYGYHVIKLFGRYAYYGKAQLAHIWVPDSDPNAKGKIYSAYEHLQQGEDFAKVARNYSGDRNSATNGGLMPELSCNQLPPDYVAAVSAGIKEGEYSQPFHSTYGWHIVKLIKQETIPPFESMVPYYKSRMTRGERSTRPQHIFVEQCKARYNFVDFTQQKTSKKKNAPYAASLAAVRSVITDSIFSAIFHYDSNQITDMRPLFQIGDKQYNSRQLARYIYKNKKVRQLCDLDVFVRERYKEFIEAKVLEYADKHLEQDNAEFSALLEEYRHGLMIFAYNDKMIWSRAMRDTAGFADFYAKASLTHNIDDTNDAVYFWNERARVGILTVADSACLAPEKAVKILSKGLKKGADLSEFKSSLTAKINTKKCTGEEPVTVDAQTVEKDRQDLLESAEWRLGVYTRPQDKGYRCLVVQQLLNPCPKSAVEARGYYLNDYQNYLEQEILKQLREKYNVVIHQDVVDEITY